MRPTNIDNLTVDELKELRREINRKIRAGDRSCRTKTATLRHTDSGTYLHRWEWQVVLTETKYGYCTEAISSIKNKVVIKAETREQAIDGLDSLIAELTELSELAKQEVIE